VKVIKSHLLASVQHIYLNMWVLLILSLGFMEFPIPRHSYNFILGF